MTYQTVYSSESTFPMQAGDLEELLARARRKNAIDGISGALVYTDGMFLQILEGERAKVQALMATIRSDVRHTRVTILREGDVASAQFASWKMAYVGATPEQVASWAGLGSASGPGEDDSLRRTAQFVVDVLALIAPDQAR